MYLRTLEIYFLKYTNLIPQKVLSAPWLAWQAALKKTKVKLDLSVNINVLLMVKKEIRGRICHSIFQYENASNNYMKDYDKNRGSSYIQCWDVNNFYD